MLTARKAFEGQTPASLIAAILEREPTPVATLQPFTPPLAEAIVRSAWRNADDRWQSAADLATALRWAVDGATASVPAAPQPAWRRMYVVGALAALAGVALATGVLFGWRYASSGGAGADGPVRGSASHRRHVEAVARRLGGTARAFARWTASGIHRGDQGRPIQIWVRPLDSVQAQPLAVPEGASFPFWSPDGRFIAFSLRASSRGRHRGGTPDAS